MRETIRLALGVVAVAALAAGSAQAAETTTWLDTFDKPVAFRYYPPWTVRDGKLYSPGEKWGRRATFITDKFTEGTIEVTTTALKRITVAGQPFASSGLFIKRVGKDWIWMRMGAYGGMGLSGEINGKSVRAPRHPFKIKIGKPYRVKATLKDGRLKLWVDGKQYYDVPCPISTKPGQTGFYCESPCSFDDYSVTGVLPNTLRPKPLSGKPRLETVYARFRADTPRPAEVLSAHGTINIFLRNTGDGAAQLASLELNGKPIDFRSPTGPFAWYQQRPWRIQPGETGAVLLRVRGLPGDMGDRVLADLQAHPVFHLTAKWEGGVAKKFDVPFNGRAEPFQINFLAFGPKLKRLWVYAQNNAWIYGNKKTPIALTRVLVNGKDMTDHARFGERVLRGRVVPIAVNLPKPLPLRRACSVVLRASGGRLAGHVLRAIPSRTILQVTRIGRWLPRADWLEDVRNHCANAVSCGKDVHIMKRAGELGLWNGQFGGGLSYVKRFERPGMPIMVSCWMDEVDKRDPWAFYPGLRRMDRTLLEDGKRAPFHIANIINVWSPGGVDFMEMTDGVMHAYGYRGGNLGKKFGRAESLPWREHRSGRRPFIPYFRNAEVPVPVDVKKKVGKEHDKTYRRCLSPEEERWIYYGCLLQGAKGVQHWGYTARFSARGFYNTPGPIIRLGLGAGGAGRCWQYKLRKQTVDMLRATWDEIGRCNAEWRAIAPYIAISDVSRRARVVSCRPAKNSSGEPGASASALLAGLDGMVVVTLNQNVKRTGLSSDKPSVFTPTRATVDVALPPWLEPVAIFRVTYKGLTDLKPKRLAGRVLRFVTTVKVNDLIVITADPGMKAGAQETLSEMQRNLEKMQTHRAVHTKMKSPYKD